MLKRIALATLVVALVGAAGAVAHTTDYPSDITFDLLRCDNCAPKRAGGEPDSWVAGGEVFSVKAACVPGRKVKLYAASTTVPKHGPVPPPELLDIDRTSTNGAWSARFDNDLVGVDHLEARLVEKNIGPQGHRHICDEDVALSSWLRRAGLQSRQKPPTCRNSARTESGYFPSAQASSERLITIRSASIVTATRRWPFQCSE